MMPVWCSRAGELRGVPSRLEGYPGALEHHHVEHTGWGAMWGAGALALLALFGYKL